MVEYKVLVRAQVFTEETRKIALERRMMPSIRSIFSQMVSEYIAILSATGVVPRATDFQGEWAAILMQQYRRVGRQFLNNQRRSKFYDAMLYIKQSLTPEENLSLISAYSIWSRGFGEDQSEFVTETNQKQYEESLKRAQEDLGEGTSPALMALAAGVILRKFFRSRVETIANVQTQAPAEEAKRLESIALSEANGIDPEEIDKMWQTQEDERVRPAHVEANQQTRQEGEFFIVAGERLMYPGDTSNGASLENTVNCRCSSIYAKPR